MIQLLNEMTLELKAQFEFFRDLRNRNEHSSEMDDDIGGKQMRTDMKAATDAMSLMVRTLEKIDALQRQFAAESERQDEMFGEGQDYEKAVAFFLKRIDELASERFKEKWAAASISSQRGQGEAAP